MLVIAVFMTLPAVADFGPRLAPLPAPEQESIEIQLGSAPAIEFASLIRRIRTGEMTARCVTVKRGNTELARLYPSAKRRVDQCSPWYCPCQCTLENDQCLADCEAQQGTPANCDFYCRPSYEACMGGC
ncbi:MAG TPA: hypothetical protein VGF28_04545 [Thermoanaerobaculia bacterium]